MARVRRVWLVAVAIICVWGVPRGLSQGEEKLDIVHGPYLQAITESSATVVWFTNKNCVSRVEYAPCDSNELTTAVASHHGLVDANARIHRVALTGLKPGIRYNYHVISREMVIFDPYQVVYGDTITEGPYRVQTWNPRKDKSSFCVVNDIHGRADRLESLLDLVPLANGRAYGVTRIRELWSPILNEANIDLAFCGHTHRFARIAPNESANHYPILVNAPDMVVHVDVSESRLDVTIKKIDGQVVDRVALKPRLRN